MPNLAEKMVNLPDHLYEDYSQLMLTSSLTSSQASTSAAPPPTIPSQPSKDMLKWWIHDLNSQIPAMSDFALQNLVEHRNDSEILPDLLWDSHGTVAMLLNEVTRTCVHIIGHIARPLFPPLQPCRVYNILLLFQSIAHCPKTRVKFLKAKMPIYFYALMDISPVDRSYESLRLGALGVIAHMVKGPSEEAALRFLMDTGAFSHCVKAVEFGCTDSKTLAVFILQQIMSIDDGLQYCVVLPDRYFAIDELLKKLLVYLTTRRIPSSSLFSLVVSCYLRLSEKDRAHLGLRRYPPDLLFDGTFARLLAEDPVADFRCTQLYQTIHSRINGAAERMLSNNH